MNITNAITSHLSENDKILSLKIMSEVYGSKTSVRFQAKESGPNRCPKLKLISEVPTDIATVQGTMSSIFGESQRVNSKSDTSTEVDEVGWSSGQINPEDIKVQVMDILGRIVNETTKDKLSSINLRDGVYIIVETANVNGIIRKESRKVNVIN